jgi:hypothetical protein
MPDRMNCDFGLSDLVNNQVRVRLSAKAQEASRAAMSDRLLPGSGEDRAHPFLVVRFKVKIEFFLLDLSLQGLRIFDI